ncbi:thioesterase family protein [Geomesophilobacter sediminis]|uniref:Thioesterase family protein n=1 Tax=Geomesophilobacter sediminis TaxID=2798584 RepID=A0A8J7JF91_9BACT|nr:thioesterase family protein [Geomesophilobacter sediminis]MBJ6724914.1 thioesterase family protein [Geomesophilobacter sediminis]
MKDTLQAGLEQTLKYRVPRERTVPFLYPESDHFRIMPEVFATGYLVGFIEWACMEALAPHLEEGERTVGTMINVTHEAATPVGMEVTATVRCVEVDGKRTVWAVEARDEVDVIGRGTHERFVINYDKFTQRVATKGKK